ncbi:16S rRNA pseudouridine(516) synthase RsuA [Gilvimarinus polysaccharolyticus]|uniref:16S rRNA pseudouridine(516) synthase RsuA n=1 Tax=Gilvimarinus polysaccharolyticus TaxID=863921 RepID=UPI0006736836|nr:16S rRNA pseudouridine(516) synthase RsuA [Gilvimarinus polysaccharolyticus]
MRLDKYIAHCTGAGRKEVKRWLHAEQVTVAGTTVKNSGQKITPEQTVLLNGQTLQYPSPRYLMLNKPAGVVCANDDGEHPTVLDCLGDTDTRDLQIAGRLDKDTTGLVLITDDGQWNHKITAPRAAKDKVYWVTTAEPITELCITQFAKGLQLKGESKLTLPATLELIGECEARVTLHEGRYHQVKRMFAACGNHVRRLHRESVAGIVLDAALAPGQFRSLTEAEIAQTLTPNKTITSTDL